MLLRCTFDIVQCTVKMLIYLRELYKSMKNKLHIPDPKQLKVSETEIFQLLQE